MSEETKSKQAAGAEDQSRYTSDPHRVRIEWATLIVSAALLLGVAAILVHAHITAGDPAPLIETRVDTASARREDGTDTFHVPVLVHNRGRAGARDIQVRVAPVRPGGGGDTVDLTLDVLPPGASETAVVVLRGDPTRIPVEARVASYLTD